MANVCKILTEQTNKNQDQLEVITLSSDEEESAQNDKDVLFLFQRFILACRRHVPKQAIKDVRSLFTEVRGQLTASSDLTNKLERYCNEITKNNADLYITLISRALNQTKVSLESKSLNVTESNSKGSGTVGKSVTFCDVSEARGFEETTTKQNENTIESVPEIPTIVDDGDDNFVSKKTSKKSTKKIPSIPSTSREYQEIKVDKMKGKISIKTLNRKEKKKLVAQLKQRLKEISNEIRILNRTELTLEEMDMCDSTYIKESRLKKRFDKTWNKLCKLLGRPPNTGRVIEKPVRASSTGNPMIDKAIARFMKERHGSFPNYFDIRDIVVKTDQKHDLRMSPQVLNGIIVDIFTDIGNKIQRRRERDLIFNFGSHLLDDFKTEDDPALHNEDLAMQLGENRRLAERNLKQVFTKYTHLERYERGDKLRKSSGTSVNWDQNSEPGTSDDEQGQKSSKKPRKHARLVCHEVMGKSRMKKGSSRTPYPSRVMVNGDISSESDSSGDEQDPSRTANDDSIVDVDSDAPSSQEVSVVSVSPSIATEASLSNIEQSLSDGSYVVVPLSDNDGPQSPVFPITDTKQIDVVTSQESKSTNIQDLSDDTCRNKHNVSSSNDCEIINDPIPQLDNSKLLSDRNDCEIINDCAERKQTFDGVANECWKKKSQQETNSDGEIVHSPKEQLHEVTTKLNQQSNEASLVSEPHSSIDDVCLIIDDSQDDESTENHQNPLKIPTSMPSDELMRTINTLRDVFRRRSTDVHQSDAPPKSRDQSTESKETLSQCVPYRMNDNDLISTSKNSDSHTVPSKFCSNQSIGDHAYPKPIKFVYDDVNCTTPKNLRERPSVANYRPTSPTVDINDTLACNLRSNHDETQKNRNLNQSLLTTSTDLNANVGISKNPVANSCSHSPVNSTSETSNLTNSRKRKASPEFSLRIPKSSVKCLEQIALALKNKRLKLPNAWVNCKNVEKTSNDSFSKPTTSNEPSTLTNNYLTSHKPTKLQEKIVDQVLASGENDPQLMIDKAKIDLQHKQVFREKTLTALKIPPKQVCSSPSQTAASNVLSPTTVNVHKAEKLDVIVIDD